MTDDEIFNPRELAFKMLETAKENTPRHAMIAAASLAGFLINICSDDSEDKKAVIKFAIEVLRHYANEELRLCPPQLIQ